MLNKSKKAVAASNSSNDKKKSKSKKEQHEVTLVIYDLARGLARDLTKQILGPKHAIDVVPHTGIIVYGKEYYFAGGGKNGGGGIFHDDPESFRRCHGNMQPIEMIKLGSTDCSKSDFNTWCKDNTNYRGTSYHLLRNNCNNFSHDAVKHILYSGGDCIIDNAYPTWIVEVPERILTSPMGKVVYPILQNMQIAAAEIKRSAPIIKKAAEAEIKRAAPKIKKVFNAR